MTKSKGNPIKVPRPKQRENDSLDI